MHADYKFSITMKSDDLPLVNCLRALSASCQRTGNTRIPWGGTKEEDWRRDDRCVTFHFNRADYRASFLSEVTRLLPQALWSTVSQSDSDPAKKQSR
jgi:hypothetical protein